MLGSLFHRLTDFSVLRVKLITSDLAAILLAAMGLCTANVYFHYSAPVFYCRDFPTCLLFHPVLLMGILQNSKSSVVWERKDLAWGAFSKVGFQGKICLTIKLPIVPTDPTFSNILTTVVDRRKKMKMQSKKPGL